MKMKYLPLIALCIFITSLSRSLCQTTNIVFTGISATDEGNIRLAWSSMSNEIYEIDEADSLTNASIGTTTWNQLYKEYPSQGTNTFWLDTGNYNLTPAILQPKDMPMRFYRILDLGPDTLSDEPSVSITSPTNDAYASDELTITVAASTDQPVLWGTKLYVDGQEMYPAGSTTNYTDSTGVTNYEVDTYNINTCEWGNGAHTLFATTKNASDFGGDLNGSVVSYGHAVSAFIPVTFSNLITRISFSQPFFNPSVGETQQVSAIFAANSDWTLNIEDANSNVVLTATGSGTSMSYNWDGNGTGETNLPSGIYYYYISASTNGEPVEIGGGGSGGSGGSPPTPMFASESSRLWAVAPDSEIVVPLVLYPPGFDTNDLTIFSASPTEIRALTAPNVGEDSLATQGGVSPNFRGTPPSQNAPPTPQRAPVKAVKGIVGMFAIANQDYTFSGLTLSTPLNGFPVIPGENAQHVQLQNKNSNTAYCPYLESVSLDNFITQMARGAWMPGLNKENSQLKASDLQGSGSPYNQFPLGIIALHGAYGTSPDYNANQCEQMYFPIDGRPNSASSWVSMSQMNFGGAGTNGLKWMALAACNSLYQNNWQSLQNSRITPFNGNLHLLLGADSDMDTGGVDLWAKYMLGLDNNRARPIMQAWYDSGAACVHPPVTFAVVGYNDCEQDMLNPTNSTTPSGSIFYDSRLVDP